MCEREGEALANIMSIASIILSVHPGLWWPIRHRERFHSKAVDNSINLTRPTTMKLAKTRSRGEEKEKTISYYGITNAIKGILFLISFQFYKNILNI